MDSVELVKKICKERKIPISRLERDCGFSNGYIRKLQEGKFPSDRLLIISDYLNLPITYLMTGKMEVQNEIALTAKDQRDIKKDLNNIMEKLSSGDAGPASYDGEELDPEAAELFRDELEIALRRLKIINKEKYTPKKYKK
ncbi:Uncharacterised protein [[Eubacterium] contortum]|uniref:HTH cro/C1-type domain-containing protein n=1 Tax=Faecalicatena contorta TaxID=39482 RepID=A0A174J160_9FIRM|nr:helix-turn-helix transcriptional regulator [Faecalicatena contorta]CUO92391.1 Uncharacterised protein [[Eubacterium] contortum] [Faecalicatena contorta]